MGAWFLVSLVPPPTNATLFVRSGGDMRDAALIDTWRTCWIGICQGREYDLKAPPVEWWDPEAETPEERQAPAPIPQEPPKGQLSFQF